MPSSIKITKNLRRLSRLTRVDVSGALLEAGQRIVAPRIRQNIRDSIDINGAPFQPLKSSRVRPSLGQKRIFARGKRLRADIGMARAQDKPLIDTGRLLNSIKARRAGINHVQIHIRRMDRKKIAVYQHYGTDKIPARSFFGIQDAHKPRIMRQVNQIIKREILRATGF